MRVYQYILEGWPQGGVNDDLKSYHQKQDQLSSDQGCILWGTRVVIPQVLQAHLLKELHYTHPGIVKMKLLAHIAICGGQSWTRTLKRLLKAVRTVPHKEACLR